MSTSRAAVFSRSGLPIEIVDIAIPLLQSGEILVRNEMAALCRSDLATCSGKRVELSPTILGHEVVGRVADFGPGAPRVDLRGSPLNVGDRITWAIFASDPTSEMAMRGMPQKGPGRFKYGHERLDGTNTLHGGLAEHIILRPHTPLIRIEEEVPVQVAAIVNCAVATIAGALRTAGAIEERRVFISGSGMLGVLACAMARFRGASRVAAMDIDAGRLEIAKRFGADVTIEIESVPERASSIALSNFEAVDVVVETSGVPGSMEATLEKLAVGGVAVWVGAVHPDRPIALDAQHIVRNLLAIRGLHNYNTGDFLAAVEFIESIHRTLPIRDLVEDAFGLDQINEAFAYAMSSKAFRVGVHL